MVNIFTEMCVITLKLESIDRDRLRNLCTEGQLLTNLCKQGSSDDGGAIKDVTCVECQQSSNWHKMA